MTRIRYCLAPNPGPWTHTGTNSWILGQEALVVIDPGPDMDAHLAALLDAIAGQKVAAILVTHAHRDHSGLAPRLAKATGAPVLAAAHPLGPKPVEGTPGPGVDLDFRPTEALRDGQRLDLAGLHLRALHTPGHLGSHFCFALSTPDGEALFSGDHVMGWSSSVVSPPEGDMAAYRASLARLAQGRWCRIYPGHGPAIADPAGRIAALIAHRDAREAEILSELAKGPAAPEELRQRLYPGLDPALKAAAEGNVRAHLDQLRAEGKVAATAPLFRLETPNSAP